MLSASSSRAPLTSASFQQAFRHACEISLPPSAANRMPRHGLPLSPAHFRLYRPTAGDPSGCGSSSGSVTPHPFTPYPTPMNQVSTPYPWMRPLEILTPPLRVDAKEEIAGKTKEEPSSYFDVALAESLNYQNRGEAQERNVKAKEANDTRALPEPTVKDNRVFFRRASINLIPSIIPTLEHLRLDDFALEAKETATQFHQGAQATPANFNLDVFKTGEQSKKRRKPSFVLPIVHELQGPPQPRVKGDAASEQAHVHYAELEAPPKLKSESRKRGLISVKDRMPTPYTEKISYF